MDLGAERPAKLQRSSGRLCAGLQRGLVHSRSMTSGWLESATLSLGVSPSQVFADAPPAVVAASLPGATLTVGGTPGERGHRAGRRAAGRGRKQGDLDLERVERPQRRGSSSRFHHSCDD